MTKQEEIRQGIKRITRGYMMTNAILQYLHSEDVVIKVDRESSCNGCPVAVVCGYVAVEPLIEETDD